MTLNDLKPLKWGVGEFFAISGCDWIALKWLKMDQDNLQMKFLALNVDFSNPSPAPAFNEACARVCQRRLLPKSGYFSAIGLSSVKTVTDRH